MIMRCICGSLASSRHPCKKCGKDTHLAHGHAPDDDPGHFERVEHEWTHSGGTHVPEGAIGSERWQGEPCPHAHRHPEPFSGHDHEGHR